MKNATDIWKVMPRHLVAILRGLQPGETEAVTAALIGAGIRAIEIPLNRPNAMQSVEIAVRVQRRSAKTTLSGPARCCPQRLCGRSRMLAVIWWWRQTKTPR